MLPEMPIDIAKQLESRREYVSEAFHSLNQPLTALHCGLELSLLKERREEEYRERIEDALTNAGKVLQLSKAVRELVEAADPGEDLQEVELQPVFSNLADQLSVVAESSLIAVKFDCPDSVAVGADATKLTCHLGNLASILMRKLEPGGQLELSAQTEENVVVICLSGKGKQRDIVEDGVQKRLDDIRMDAACSYAWTLGGEFRKDVSTCIIRLKTLNQLACG